MTGKSKVSETHSVSDPGGLMGVPSAVFGEGKAWEGEGGLAARCPVDAGVAAALGLICCTCQAGPGHLAGLGPLVTHQCEACAWYW